MNPIRLLSTLFLLAGVASTQDLSHEEFTGFGLERPGVEDGPTEVLVGLYVIDLPSIDSAKQELLIDFVLTASWHDERLAGGAARTLDLSEAWTPRLQVANELRLLKKNPEKLNVDVLGRVVYAQRFLGTLGAPADLRSFPLDRHHFAIRVVGAAEDVRGLRLVPLEERTGQAQDLSIPDWEVGQGAARLSTYVFPPTGQELPELRYEFPARRLTTFYIWKLLVPLSLIVVMSWAVFYIDPGQLGPRMSVAVTSMLTVIAYRFILGQFIPRLPYLTRLDLYSLVCTTFILLALIQVVVGAGLLERERLETARRANRVCRVLFPIGLLIVIVVMTR